ncbi:CinA family protein [Ornithinimicrobium tianjinense]|uniref:Competence damage-inducible protein A n=1 Tax=Ornithinimicrobium tianjinense TaxID=1195761 RepID=A0A917BPG0_9MICO|nr:nicotinamide-nucleotide amidohydrolase family protein [Ornithinimicrobium tianjinense]GGF51185.1 competence damage-inducible protein A [Ornithinimicrobium tianjinense]
MTAAPVTTAARVVGLLREAGQTVAAAESLTGGLVTAALTDVPGSSAVVAGGVVAYTPAAKIEVLGVPPGVVEGHGVVSRECAEAMADGVRALLGADWALSTTGVAGPGPSDGHPAGTVHIAVVGPRDTPGLPALPGESGRVHRALSLVGDRTAVRVSAVEAVLQLLEEALRGGLSAPGGTVGISSTDGTDAAEEG